MEVIAPALMFLIFIFGTLLDPEDKSMVILVPDPNGHVGEVEVRTEGGRRILDEAGAMTVVKGPKSPPSTVTHADAAFIRETFAQALAAEPLPPEKFLLYFLPGGPELTEESRALLPRVLESIQQRDSRDISINGHTDRVGSNEVNIAISLKRALAIRDFLVAQGVPDAFLHPGSHGEGNPLLATPDGVAEPKNRRVEILVR